MQNKRIHYEIYQVVRSDNEENDGVQASYHVSIGAESGKTAGILGRTWKLHWTPSFHDCSGDQDAADGPSKLLVGIFP